MKILKRILLMLSAVWILTACNSTTAIKPIPRLPPPALIEPIPDLPPAMDGKLATILLNSLERNQMYYECQARHKALSEWANQ